jgi:hypothetical protein
MTLGSDNETVIVHVMTAPDVAKYIRERQIYFSIVIDECGTDGVKRFPTEPFVQSTRASDFHYEIDESGVEFTSGSPKRIIADYKKPCVLLEGGGYTGARLKTNQLPLELR